MEEFLNKNCLIFDGIPPNDIKTLLECLSSFKKRYKKGNYIISEGDSVRNIGIIIEGKCQILRDDFWGNRSILMYLASGNTFGEAFNLSDDGKSKVNVVAIEDCLILFVDINKITTVCTHVCKFHSKLIKNLLKNIVSKNINLTDKIEFLTRKTTRQKVISYLSAVARQQNSSAITIPFDRQGLADFLSVERSALSHELGLMQKQGLIEFHKNKFILKKDPKYNE